MYFSGFYYKNKEYISMVIQALHCAIYKDYNRLYKSNMAGGNTVDILTVHN